MAQQLKVLDRERVCVLGIGGAGCHILDRLATRWPDGPVLAALDTDAQILAGVQAPARVQIGTKITGGHGAGGRPSVGRTVAETDIRVIRELLADKDVAVCIAGLGGGTGTGMLPVIAEAAREKAVMTLCYCTLPFDFEGGARMQQASQGLEDIREAADLLVCIPNQRLFELMSPDTPLSEAFSRAAEILGAGVYALTKLLLSSGLINLDIADLRAVAQQSDGVCCFGYGEARGEDRAETAARAVLESPLLDGGKALAGAGSVLVSVFGGGDLTLREVDTVMSAVAKAADKDAHLFVGAALDESFAGAMVVTLLASARATGRQAGPSGTRAATATLFDIGAAGKGRKTRHARRKGKEQSNLLLAERSRDRFRNVEPTIHEGENLDIPTYKRRGIQIGHGGGR